MLHWARDRLFDRAGIAAPHVFASGGVGSGNVLPKGKRCEEIRLLERLKFILAHERPFNRAEKAERLWTM